MTDCRHATTEESMIDLIAKNCVRCAAKIEKGHWDIYCQACLDAEEYEDNDSIRCPHCLRVMDDCLWEFAAYDEGYWEATCEFCEGAFEVKTIVNYSFVSPAQGKATLDE